VTQQFNTTSSMGRLTLNVLLSFAQFEREVTGERIRDKIAASKKKGMWMGGNVPLGYDADERALVINPAEAETVRHLFALYRQHGCVRRVKDEADRLGLRTKRIRTANGAERGGASFSRGHIYRLLSNPIYIGQIGHKDQLYPGQHPALIDDETWTVVRDQLAANAGDHRRRAKAAEASLLVGLLVDAHGARLTPSHAVKKGRRYRYYVSTALISEAGQDHTPPWRLAAQEIEDCVISILVDALTSPARLLERLSSPGMPGDQIRRLLGRAARLAALLRSAPGERAKIVQELVDQVIVDDKRIMIKMRRGALLGVEASLCASEEPSGSTIELTAAVDFKRRGAETKLVGGLLTEMALVMPRTGRRADILVCMVPGRGDLSVRCRRCDHRRVFLEARQALLMELRIGNRAALLAHSRLAEGAVCLQHSSVMVAMHDVLAGRRGIGVGGHGHDRGQASRCESQTG
jgi:hypothetical protein